MLVLSLDFTAFDPVKTHPKDVKNNPWKGAYTAAKRC